MLPYITREERKNLDPTIEELIRKLLENPENIEGCLNYVIFKILKRLTEKERRYKTMNKFIGMLECCKNEYYRKIVAPYEDEKERINGEIT